MLTPVGGERLAHVHDLGEGGAPGIATNEQLVGAGVDQLPLCLHFLPFCHLSTDRGLAGGLPLCCCHVDLQSRRSQAHDYAGWDYAGLWTSPKNDPALSE